MKKITLSLLVCVFGMLSIQAQKKNNFEMGFYLGVPIVSDKNPYANAEWIYEGELSTEYNFNFGVNFAYYFGITDKIKVGILTGYDHFIIDASDENIEIVYDENIPYPDFDAESESYVPIAVSSKFFFADKFFAGLDLGYAIDLSGDKGAGGFYYRPRVSWSTRVIDFYAFYKGMNFKNYGYPVQLGSAGLGLNFKF